MVFVGGQSGLRLMNVLLFDCLTKTKKSVHWLRENNKNAVVVVALVEEKYLKI